jgi:U3 small nucleolar RNA-associated protein 14
MLKWVIVVAGNRREDHAVVDADEDTKPVMTRNRAETQEELVRKVWRIKLWL